MQTVLTPPMRPGCAIRLRRLLAGIANGLQPDTLALALAGLFLFVFLGIRPRSPTYASAFVAASVRDSQQSPLIYPALVMSHGVQTLRIKPAEVEKQ